MDLSPIHFEALGSMLAGSGAIASAAITYVFYKELTSIERERSHRETTEFERQKKAEIQAQRLEIFEKRVRDFVEELRGRSSTTYPIHEVMMDIVQSDAERREIAVEALNRYLQRKEKIPSERESLREMIMSNLDAAEPQSWPGWETRLS